MRIAVMSMVNTALTSRPIHARGPPWATNLRPSAVPISQLVRLTSTRPAPMTMASRNGISLVARQNFYIRRGESTRQFFRGTPSQAIVAAQRISIAENQNARHIQSPVFSRPSSAVWKKIPGAPRCQIVPASSIGYFPANSFFTISLTSFPPSHFVLRSIFVLSSLIFLPSGASRVVRPSAADAAGA